jgi:hypothetical protein
MKGSFVERLFQVPAGARMVMSTATSERALSTLSNSEKLRTLLLGNFMDRYFVLSASVELYPVQVRAIEPDGEQKVFYEVSGTLSIYLRASTHEDALHRARIFCREIQKRVPSLSIKELEQCVFEVHADVVEIVA